MPGIPAKCLDCGQILVYEGRRWVYSCPNCETKTAETTKPEELKKAA
jgi:predicted RNA-binding Zn-ribbon protein involved in translation (DUF1610 family)